MIVSQSRWALIRRFCIPPSEFCWCCAASVTRRQKVDHTVRKSARGNAIARKRGGNGMASGSPPFSRWQSNIRGQPRRRTDRNPGKIHTAEDRRAAKATPPPAIRPTQRCRARADILAFGRSIHPGPCQDHQRERAWRRGRSAGCGAGRRYSIQGGPSRRRVSPRGTDDVSGSARGNRRTIIRANQAGQQPLYPTQNRRSSRHRQWSSSACKPSRQTRTAQARARPIGEGARRSPATTHWPTSGPNAISAIRAPPVAAARRIQAVAGGEGRGAGDKAPVAPAVPQSGSKRVHSAGPITPRPSAIAQARARRGRGHPRPGSA